MFTEIDLVIFFYLKNLLCHQLFSIDESPSVTLEVLDIELVFFQEKFSMGPRDISTFEEVFKGRSSSYDNLVRDFNGFVLDCYEKTHNALSIKTFNA